MAMSALLVIFLLTHVVGIFSALPPVQKCKLSDSNCLKTSAQLAVPAVAAGIPEIRSESLDPMHVDLIKVDLSGLKLTLRDAEIKGLRKSIIDKLSIDTAKKRIELVFHVDIVVRSKYKAEGKLIILPISGDGDAVIKLKNCQIIMDMLFDIDKDQNGLDVIDVKSYTFKYDVINNAHFHLTNLFNGNKALSDAILNFMNGSWKLLSQEFGEPLIENPLQKVFTAIQTYLKSQPLAEIANI